MCNPPFYTSRDELIESAKQKKRPPFSVCENWPLYFDITSHTYISHLYLLPCTVLTMYLGMHWCRGGNGDPWRGG